MPAACASTTMPSPRKMRRSSSKARRCASRNPSGTTSMPTFRQAREFLLANRTAYDKAVAGFQWPDPVPFNWALDWFDAELAHAADSKDRCALWIVDVAAGRETKLTFAELATRSNPVANYLSHQGLGRAGPLPLVPNNAAPLWEPMLAPL